MYLSLVTHPPQKDIWHVIKYKEERGAAQSALSVCYEVRNGRQDNGLKIGPLLSHTRSISIVQFDVESSSVCTNMSFRFWILDGQSHYLHLDVQPASFKRSIWKRLSIQEKKIVLKRTYTCSPSASKGGSDSQYQQEVIQEERAYNINFKATPFITFYPNQDNTLSISTFNTTPPSFMQQLNIEYITVTCVQTKPSLLLCWMPGPWRRTCTLLGLKITFCDIGGEEESIEPEVS